MISTVAPIPFNHRFTAATLRVYHAGRQLFDLHELIESEEYRLLNKQDREAVDNQLRYHIHQASSAARELELTFPDPTRKQPEVSHANGRKKHRR